jgi:peptide/nickel transport system permease protein
MIMFLIRRIASMLGVLLALTVALFALQEVSGIDPAKAYVGANASAEALERTRVALGLDQPAISRYFDYLGGLFQGALQNSLRTRPPPRVSAPRFPRRSNSPCGPSDSRWFSVRCSRCSPS